MMECPALTHCLYNEQSIFLQRCLLMFHICVIFHAHFRSQKSFHPFFPNITYPVLHSHELIIYFLALRSQDKDTPKPREKNKTMLDAPQPIKHTGQPCSMDTKLSATGAAFWEDFWFSSLFLMLPYKSGSLPAQLSCARSLIAAAGKDKPFCLHGCLCISS